MSKVIVRFAPSPTGFLHIGSLRTALFNWLWARKHKGKFILRIEDTDKERYIEGAVDNIIEALKWYGLDFDEGPVFQSKRLDIYKKYTAQLIEQGSAYYCFCSSERLDEIRKIQKANKQATQYDGLCRSLSKEEVDKKLEQNMPHVIRLKVPEEGITEFTDMVYKRVSVDNNEIDDQILLKSDGYPTYHLANVVDDHEQGITHVIRAEEWLPSTPKHILLYEAFGWTPPQFAHLPMVLGPDRSKLSKRHGAKAALDYKKDYLPEAIINFIALLGWNPKTDQEIFSLNELIKEFDLSKINKASAIFNLEKLNWLNGRYIKRMNLDNLVLMCKKYVPIKDEDEKMFREIVKLHQNRMQTFIDIVKYYHYYKRTELEYDQNILIPKGGLREETIEYLELSLEKIKKIHPANYKASTLKVDFEALIKERGLTNKVILWPLRVAITGLEKSPGVFEMMEAHGKYRVIELVENALKMLK